MLEKKTIGKQRNIKRSFFLLIKTDALFVYLGIYSEYIAIYERFISYLKNRPVRNDAHATHSLVAFPKRDIDV